MHHRRGTTPMDDVEKIELALPARPFKAGAADVVWQERKSTPGVQPGPQSLKPQEAARKLCELAAYVDDKSDPYPPDPNMELTLYFANHLVPSPGLPQSLAK